jgi:hypothetical protein
VKRSSFILPVWQKGTGCFFVNLFESNTSNRIKEKGSADKKGIPYWNRESIKYLRKVGEDK